MGQNCFKSNLIHHTLQFGCLQCRQQFPSSSFPILNPPHFLFQSIAPQLTLADIYNLLIVAIDSCVQHGERTNGEDEEEGDGGDDEALTVFLLAQHILWDDGL